MCSDNTVSSRSGGDREEAASALHSEEICSGDTLDLEEKSVANVDLTSLKHPAWSRWVPARFVARVGERGLSACLVSLPVA